ncbi:hypothetical protein CSB09_00155 [Candidatus Gracilibacteria bacterium]|nr:MAG: hypothetical protein CSB09_00155 [Candidatus Gracilibacteria bacterium]
MQYKHEFHLEKESGNNALSYKKRKEILKKNPSLTIPKIINGTLEDVQYGEHIVFEEVDENGNLQSCKGLKNFVRLDISSLPPIIVFDNHNHALYFWYEALHLGHLQSPFELIHMDEHSDLWENKNPLDHEKAMKNLKYAWEFTNYQCNVGNYIEPLLKNNTIKTMIRLENEFEIEKYKNYIPPKKSVFNLDIDIFAPEMDFIPERKKIDCIKNILPNVSLVTIAMSPYFISPGLALRKLHRIFTNFDLQVPRNR